MATKTQYTFRPIGGSQVLEPRLWNETNTYVEDAIDEIFDALAGGSGVVASRVFQDIAGDNVTQSLSIIDSQTQPSLLARARIVFGTTAGVTNSSSFITLWTNEDGLGRLERLRVQPNGLISFGGTGAGFPALKRNATALQVRLADDSGDAPLSAGAITQSGVLLTDTYVEKAGDVMTGSLAVESTVARELAVRTDADAFLRAESFVNSGGPFLEHRRARGSRASPTDVLQDNNIAIYDAYARLSGAFSLVSRRSISVTAGTPSSTARDARYTMELGVGSNLTEIMRLEHATGLSLFGANPVIDQNRHRRTRSYTIGTLPTAAVAGEVIQVSDLGGGSGSVESTGASSSWRRRTPGYGTLGDASVTVTPLTEAENLNLTATLTANRVITLSATRAYVGARFFIRRTGLGAFTLTIDNHDGTDLFVFASGVGGAAVFVYNGTDWVLMGSMS